MKFFIHKKFVWQRRNLRILRLHKNSDENSANYPVVFSNHIFYPSLIHLTNCRFSNSEFQLITKSFKFNIQPINKRKDA